MSRKQIERGAQYSSRAYPAMTSLDRTKKDTWKWRDSQESRARSSKSHGEQWTGAWLKQLLIFMLGALTIQPNVISELCDHFFCIPLFSFPNGNICHRYPVLFFIKYSEYRGIRADSVFFFCFLNKTPAQERPHPDLMWRLTQSWTASPTGWDF